MTPPRAGDDVTAPRSPRRATSPRGPKGEQGTDSPEMITLTPVDDHVASSSEDAAAFLHVDYDANNYNFVDKNNNYRVVAAPLTPRSRAHSAATAPTKRITTAGASRRREGSGAAVLQHEAASRATARRATSQPTSGQLLTDDNKNKDHAGAGAVVDKQNTTATAGSSPRNTTTAAPAQPQERKSASFFSLLSRVSTAAVDALVSPGRKTASASKTSVVSSGVGNIKQEAEQNKRMSLASVESTGNNSAPSPQQKLLQKKVTGQVVDTGQSTNNRSGGAAAAPVISRESSSTRSLQSTGSVRDLLAAEHQQPASTSRAGGGPRQVTSSDSGSDKGGQRAPRGTRTTSAEDRRTTRKKSARQATSTVSQEQKMIKSTTSADPFDEEDTDLHSLHGHEVVTASDRPSRRASLVKKKSALGKGDSGGPAVSTPTPRGKPLLVKQSSKPDFGHMDSTSYVDELSRATSPRGPRQDAASLKHTESKTRLASTAHSHSTASLSRTASGSSRTAKKPPVEVVTTTVVSTSHKHFQGAFARFFNLITTEPDAGARVQRTRKMLSRSFSFSFRDVSSDTDSDRSRGRGAPPRTHVNEDGSTTTDLNEEQFALAAKQVFDRFGFEYDDKYLKRLQAGKAYHEKKASSGGGSNKRKKVRNARNHEPHDVQKRVELRDKRREEHGVEKTFLRQVNEEFVVKDAKPENKRYKKQMATDQEYSMRDPRRYHALLESEREDYWKNENFH
ncbi:unnamed protein product [Amoebophrya sp. A120]|nr:unnamed protein product [Amoebophrya sp. A120]|eukprot:GSA120T00012483001.1